MAASKAKRQRLALVRQGKTDPGLKRNDWNGVNPIQKMTPTLQEKKRKTWNKHKWNLAEHGRDGSICA